MTLWIPLESKNWGKVATSLCRYAGGQTFQQNRSISHPFQDKYGFAFYAEIQDGRQKWRENNFWEKSPHESADTLGSKISTKSCTVSEITAVLHFKQKFKMVAKNGRKKIFWVTYLMTLRIPLGSNISSKLLYLVPFLRYFSFSLLKKIVAFS